MTKLIFIKIAITDIQKIRVKQKNNQKKIVLAQFREGLLTYLQRIIC